MPEKSKAFGRRLRALRKERGMQQRELGELYGLSPSAIGSYERGIREPTLEQLAAFSRFFDVSLDYLLGEASERRTADQLRQTTQYEYFDFMNSHTITINGAVLNEEDKRRLCDVAVGLFWMRFTDENQS